MQALKIFEVLNFERNLDIKDSLRIGHKAHLRDKIENDHIWLENWIDELSFKYGGHFTGYLSDGLKQALANKILIEENDIKILVMNFDDYIDQVDGREYMPTNKLYDLWEKENLTPLRKKGWKIFHDQDNNDIIEIILIK